MRQETVGHVGKFDVLCYRASLVQWHQQPTRCSKICFIDSFKLALHVSGDSFAHLQEHFDCIYSFTMYRLCCLLPTGDTDWMELSSNQSVSPVDSRQQSRYIVPKKLYIQSKCSWRWANLSPETCRASLKESIKQILLHLVDCWYQCRKMFTNVTASYPRGPEFSSNPLGSY
jgi:hypothetical protein